MLQVHIAFEKIGISCPQDQPFDFSLHLIEKRNWRKKALGRLYNLSYFFSYFLRYWKCGLNKILPAKKKQINLYYSKQLFMWSILSSIYFNYNLFRETTASIIITKIKIQNVLIRKLLLLARPKENTRKVRLKLISNNTLFYWSKPLTKIINNHKTKAAYMWKIILVISFENFLKVFSRNFDFLFKRTELSHLLCRESQFI